MFVHCDAVICDSNNPHGGCISQCVNPTKTGAKTYRTADLKGDVNWDGGKGMDDWEPLNH